MDSVFQLSNGDRVSCLLNLMHSFSASYICLWTYSQDLNCLYCEEGHFQEEAASSSSSSGVSISRGLFNEYKQSVYTIGNDDLVPGFAFKNKNPYLELQELDLQRLASIELQRQFYLEAKIKIAVFLGCERGEIELGMSNIPQNLKLKMQSQFQVMDIPRSKDQHNKPTSSSSQSMDSPEYLPYLYNYPISSNFDLQQQQFLKESPSNIIDQQVTSNMQSIIPFTTMTTIAAAAATTTTATTTAMIIGVSDHLHHHPLLQNIPFPTPESTDAALTRAYLEILSSPSSCSRGGEQSCSPDSHKVRQRASAFRSYHRSSLGQCSNQNLRRQTLMKRAIAFYRGLNLSRMQEPGRPTSTQLHHMISERKRREKINESFQALRSLLPQGTKKDKASVLRTTKEYLSSLKAQLSQLSKRSQFLEAQLLKKRTSEATTTHLDVATNRNLAVNVTPVSESTSGERMVDLQVILRRETSVSDLVIRVLEFLKQVKEASIVSMEAQTHQETAGVHIHTNLVTFRLRIEGSEWDESNFTEALRRLLSDLAP